MRKIIINRYVFGEKEFKEKLGIEGDVENVEFSNMGRLKINSVIDDKGIKKEDDLDE